MNEYKPGTIITYTGKFVDPINMKPEDICLEDIAHALAMKCRFSGHCREFYSVAQHCCLAATYIQPVYQHDHTLALLHDAAEAYLFDIPRPLKDRAKFDEYSQAEKGLFLGRPELDKFCYQELVLLDIILEKYLPETKRGSWEHIDLQLLINECRVLLTNWQLMPVANEIPTIHIPIVPWGPERAEEAFLMLARLLGIED